MFGSTAYVLFAPEKRKNLDNRAVKGKAVGHLEGSKGWTFWIPATKKLVSLAWADFSRDTLLAALPDPEAKKLELGKFSEENLVTEQEHNVDVANETMRESNNDTPQTFKEAMSS